MSISNLHHQNNSICKEKYQNRTYKNETYNDGETEFRSAYNANLTNYARLLQNRRVHIGSLYVFIQGIAVYRFYRTR